MDISSISQIRLRIFYEVFLIESARLAEERIGNQLTVNPPLTVFRGYRAIVPSFIYFNSCDAITKRRLVEQYNGGFSIHTREDLMENNEPNVLRGNLQQVFNVEKLFQIIEDHKYVLTPDFAFKLYFIYERMKARENVMLSGGTGVGKTELLTLYSSIINTDVNLTFDIIYSLKKIINATIFPEIEKRNPQLKLPVLHSHQVTEIEQVIEYLSSLEANSLERFKVMSHYICKDIIDNIKNYPLLDYKSNGYVARLVRLKHQPIDWEEDQLAQQPIIVDSMNKLISLLKEYAKCTFKKIFYTIRMHQGMSAERLRIKILAIIQTAKEIESIYQQLNNQAAEEEKKRIEEPSIVVFIDEVNTTSVMGMIKSIFCDKKIDNITIPHNILWVCAINPFIKAQTNDKMSMEIEKFTGLGMDERIYSVREVPQSLKNLTIDFDTLTEDQENMFIASLLRLQNVCDNHHQYHSLTKLTLFSQRLLQRFKIHRMQVSIRDIMRTVTLYDFFRKNTCLLGATVRGTDPSNSIHWQALIMAIGTSYYLRLFSEYRNQFEEQFKEEMNNMRISNRNHECPPQLARNFGETMKSSMQHLYDNTKIPPGIACTQALLENLWSIVVCCSAMIPIIIIGPPGCSKTLSFSIAIENMSREIPDSEKTFYNHLPKLDPIRYQCSAQSTDIEIKKRYKEALARQRLYDADSAGAKSLGEVNRSVVFLDEAGLTGDKPLKVIHYYMDHPKVCTVILSNELLDAAKMNRGLQVYQNPTSHEDLISLAKGSLGIHDEKIIDKLCSAYKQTVQEGNQFTSSLRSKGLFQLRDFIYFLRYIRATAVVNGRFQITGTILLRALQRNFNGITKANLKHLVALWFKELNHVLPMPLEIPSIFKPTIDLIRENLDYRMSPNENPNTSAFRFLLLIDPTENETAVSLLYSTNLCKVDTNNAKISLLPNSIDTEAYLATMDRCEFNASVDVATFPSITKVRAIRKYQAYQHHELSFLFGDEIIVRNENLKLDGWWQGELVRTGRIGLFPYAFTSIIELEGEEVPEYLASVLSPFPKNEKYDSPIHIQSFQPKEAKKNIRKYYNPNKAVQICLGDFALDKTDDEITDAVRKVIDAMKDGKIVILVNSNLINGSFYDLFNRYFKIVKKHNEDGDDYYANVALGSFSRQCKVHKDFKVIIHLPQSKLNQTALPFLTRFEKYILSTQDVLDDLLESKPWARIPLVTSTNGKNTFVELLQKGCDEFVREIHEKDNDSRLLYGVVNTETVSSLVLESALRSDADIPNIKLMNYRKLVEETENSSQANQKLQENKESAVEKPISEFNKSSVEGKLRSLIRKANFKLLQVARPDLLFTTVRVKGIPHYIYEYFMNQEHFSVFRFLKNLINIHLRQLRAQSNSESPNESTEEGLPMEVDTGRGKQEVHTNKWCIFTRTSGEFEQLSSKDNLKKLLSEKLEKENAMEKYEIHTIQLEMIQSSKLLEQELSELCKNDHSLILYSIDMKKCTPTQINQLRRLIDHYLDAKALFVLILHFPAELFLSRAPWCYNTIYLHSWEFIYIDSLGFTMNKLNNQSIQYWEDVDARSWIAKAFGLKINHLSMDDEKMYEHYKREIIIICKNYIKKYKPDTTPPKNIQCMKIYMPGYNNKVNERYEVIDELLNHEEYILQAFIRRFINSWSKELLNKVVNSVCENLIKGNLFNSFVNTVQNTLDHFLSANVYQLMEVLLKNYQLEHCSLLLHESKNNHSSCGNKKQSVGVGGKGLLASGGNLKSASSGSAIFRNKSQFEWREIYKKTINLLKPVEFQLISQIEEKVEHNLTLVVDFPYICKTPMFPFIYTTLEKYVDILFLEFNLHHSTISILIHHFILLIEKNKNLMDLMQTVTRMKKKFLDDFLIKKFSIPVPSNHFHRPPGPNPHQKGKMLLKIMQSIVDKIVVDAIESGDISSGNKDTSALLNESATLKKNMTKDTYILLGYFVCSRYYFDKFRYIRDFIDPLHHNLFNILPIQHPILPHIHTNLSDYHNDFPLYQLGNISLSKCKYLDLYLIKLFFSILINSLSQIFNDFPINKQPQVANMEEIVNKYKLWSHLYSQFNARTSNIHSILSYFHLNKPESPADQQLVESYLKMNTLYLFSRDFNLYSKENQPQLTKLFSSGVLRNYFIKNEELFKKPAKQDEEINELYYSLQTLSLLFSEFDGFVKASPQQTSKLLKHVCRSVFKGRRTLESTNYTLTLFLENTRTLFQLINADLLPIFPNIQHAWNEVVEFDWYLNLVYSFISKRLRISSSDEDGKQAIQFEKQKQTLLNSMNYMGNEILNSNYLSSNAHFDAKKDYKYIYSLLIDDQPTIQANNNAKNTNLEDLFYHIHCKLCESQSVEELCEEYKLLKEKDDATIIEIIQLSATVSNILKNSGKYVKSEGDKVENLPDSLVEIFEKDNKGSPMHADVYFLQKHFPESINILSNPQRLNQFGFSKEWYEPQISKNNIFHKYSFMIDRTEKGLLYQEMKAVIMNNNNPAQWIQQKVAGQGERMMYISRMYLLLILFYEYFDVLLPFPPHIAQLFANQQIIGILKITASEMAAYQFILAGARVLNEDIERKDDLLRLFSRNIRQKKEDLAACYLLVNVLACCLGTPPNSNHFYKSIFELPTLNGYKMPGSACGGREFYDCGYKMSETGVLDHAGILQNHSRYRLGLNGLIWLPICWHVMLNEGTAVAVCKSLYHFINCIGDAAYGGRNELQQYRSYIASRAIGFCNVLSQDATMVERNININLFLVESLHQFSDFIQSNLGRLPNAYRHQFASVAECEQYEAQIMNLFQNVLNNYDAVKQIYQNTVIPNSPTERLTKIQDKQAKIYTKLSFKGVVDDQIVNEARNHLISVSNKFKSILDILPLMPTLATAYYHLTHELSYKLPRHMIHSPVKEVFEYLHKQITLRQIPSMTFTKLDSIKQQFTKLCDAFVILQKTILDFNNDCQVMEIPKINEECLLSVIVSQEGGYDIIINTINTLMLKLSEIFAVIRKKKYSAGTLNEHELYFPRENLEKNYDLTSLIHQIHHPISIPVVEDQFEPWMNELMSLNMHFDNNKANKNTILLVESISLDCENVNRELLMFYNSMKEFVSSVAFHSLQKAFYSSEDLPNLLEQCKNAIKLNNIDYLSMGRSNIQGGSVQNLEMIENTLKTLEPINQLKYLINKKLNKQFPEYCADLKSLDIPKSTLHKMKEETVNKMAENIIKLIKSLDDANAPDKNSKIIDELQKLNISDTPECIQLFYKSMCYLQAVANKVIELSNQKPWIYSIYGALTKINETLTAQLDAIKSKYNIKQMELEKLGGLRARTKRLLELLTHEKTLAELRHSTNKKILSFLNRLQMEKPPISYEDLLPESTEFLRYSQYMFWFHSFCGEIEYYHSIKLQQRSAAPVSSSSSAHKPAARYNELEWVPIECKQMENKNNIRSETKRLDLMNEENDDSEYDIEILNLIEEREATLQIPDEFNEYNSSNTKAIGAPGLRGIRNPGLNICWLTSLLQCIACTKGVIGDLQELRIAMNSATRKNDAQKTISYFIIDVMQQLYDEGHSKSAIDASTLFFKLGQMDYKYYFREQQDPSEFYNLYFSNNIPNELNRMKLLNFANRFNLPIKTTMNCLADASHSEILAHESQNTLFVLSVSEEVNTFDKALDLLFNSSVDTKCTKSAECKSANKMKRIRLEFMNNAKVEEEGGAGSGKFLVFHLQRSQMHHKVTSKMVIPTDPFDFSGYSLLPAGCTLKGTLYAAIIHQGDYTYFGHYIALKKIEEDWYECNDSCVSLCPNAPQLISSNGYMLFFSLECSSPPPLPSLPSPLPISLDPPAPSIPPASDSTNPYRSTTSQAGSSYQSIPPSPPVYSIQNQATHSSSTPPAPSQPAGYPPGNDPRLPYGAGSVALTQQHNYYQYYLDIIRFFLQNLWPHIGLDDPFILLQNHSQLSLFDLFERIFHFIWKSPPNPSVITTALQYSPTPRNLIDYILHLHTNPFPPPSSPANPSQFPPSTHPQYNYSSFGAGQQGNISGFYHSTGSFHNTPSFSSPYGSSHLPHPSNTPPGQYHPGQPLAVASNPLAVSSFHPSVSTSPLFHQSPSPNLFQSVPPQQAGLDPHRSFLPSSPSPPSTASFHSSIAHSPSSSSPMHHAYPQPELSSSLSASHLSHGFLQSPSSNSQSTAGYPATPHSQSGYPTSTHSQSGYPGTPQPQSQASGYPGTPQTQSGYPGYPQSGQSTGQPSSGYVQSGQYVGQASGYPHPGNMSGQPTNAQAAGYPQPGQSIGQSAGYPQPQAAGYPQQGQAYGYSQPEPSSGNLPSHGYPQAEFRNAQQLGQSRYDSQSAQYQQTHLNGNPNPTAQNVPWPGYPK